MGYDTSFEGHVTIEPPLTEVEVTYMRSRFSWRHDQKMSPGAPNDHCRWEVSSDGARIAWDGGEKFYDATEWLRYLIDHYIAGTARVVTPADQLTLDMVAEPFFRTQRTVSGVIHASGDDASDVWRIVVRNNVVTEVRPTWGPDGDA